jgi:hypothetical protein
MLHDVLRYLKHEIAQPYRMLFDLTAIDERLRKHREGLPAADCVAPGMGAPAGLRNRSVMYVSAIAST